MDRVNVQGTALLARCSRKANVTRFIYISSCAAIGYSDGMNMDESAAFNGGHNDLDIAYSVSKLASERVLMNELRNTAHVIILNPGAVISPYSNQRWGWAQVIKKIADEEVPFIPIGGVGFIEGGSIANAAEAAITRGKHGHRYLLVDENLTFFQAFNRVASLAEVSAPKFVIGKRLLNITASFCTLASQVFNLDHPPFMLAPEVARLLSRKLFYSTAAARHDLGFVPSTIDLSISSTLEWVNDTSYINGGSK